MVTNTADIYDTLHRIPGSHLLLSDAAQAAADEDMRQCALRLVDGINNAGEVVGLLVLAALGQYLNRELASRGEKT